MSISAALVKELREKTGCPMMDCKKALVEAEGNLEAAVDLLRKHGHAGAAKRRDRPTSEGFLAAAVGTDSKSAALVELLCETDFVARADDFKKLAQDLADHLLVADSPPLDGSALLGGPMASRMEDVQGTLKENIRVGRISRVDSSEGRVDAYVHFNGKIGSLIELTLSDVGLAGKEPVQQIHKDLCMQAAFSAPLGITRDDIPAEVVEKERAILAELDEVKAKPEKIQPKIIEGKLNKLYKEHAFIEQEFVKENKVSVKKMLSQVASEVGGKLDVKSLVRFEVGKE
ncbi:MAG: translation elongation factor Ts [Planctomycetota bacterium]|jgi:elongation factor Ts